MIEIVAAPIAHPTAEQIQFVQRICPSLGNYLEIREKLITGNQFGEGPLFTSEEVEEREHAYRSVGIPYRLDFSKIWRPLGIAPKEKETEPNQAHDPTRLTRPESGRTPSI